MTFISKHFLQVFDVDTGTYVLLTVICGSAVWLMRNYLANIMTVILIFPLIFGLSLLANHIFLVNGLFEPKKMSDWMIGTICASTIGVTLGLAIIAASARMWERQPA